MSGHMVKREVTEEGEVRTKRMLFQMEERDQGEDYSRQKKVPNCHYHAFCLCQLIEMDAKGGCLDGSIKMGRQRGRTELV